MHQVFDQFSPFSIVFSIIVCLLLYAALRIFKGTTQKKNSPENHPKCYPIVGMMLSVLQNVDNRFEWMTGILKTTPSSTFLVHRFIGSDDLIITANPANVKHVLKTNFQNYPKGPNFRTTFHDFLGNGIFNADGDTWKFQRQVAIHEFKTRSLKKFIETVVDTELSDRLIPILSKSAASDSVLDFQDILQRFTFDNICKISFGYDPAYLDASLPENGIVTAFDESLVLSRGRFNTIIPNLWKLKKMLRTESEKELSKFVSEMRESSRKIVNEKKTELQENRANVGDDLLSKFLGSGHQDENFVVDIVISFILAGRDTTSAALTWFFWLVSQNPKVEEQIVKEIQEKSETEMQGYDEAKEMLYTHAALCESMRLYPPVPTDSKEAINDDVLPDGTKVKKGMSVVYHTYAMGRMENLWGSDWAEFKPERWLEKEAEEKWKFIGIDPYVYPVFQAGPRICLGKEMAFLQMKRIVGSVLQRFKVVPAVDGFQPAFVAHLTAKMKGGFPVRFVGRKDVDHDKKGKVL